MWVVEKFHDVHNHPLTTTPSKVIKHRSHSKYHRTNVCKSLVADLNNKGLRPSQIVMKPSEEAELLQMDSNTVTLAAYLINALSIPQLMCYLLNSALVEL
ncbi:hypothetical protein RJ640_016599 [Escallonia rubra]|uniref:Protein FAR1-RELATED SEQUENCE n=1 Tax=Escallonia rubra TaxID=112253 RepID=A0AA88UQC6_9ASTE|nr:hypothetical protein RJ640_016599 [Escallonia rubra]